MRAQLRSDPGHVLIVRPPGRRNQAASAGVGLSSARARETFDARGKEALREAPRTAKTKNGYLGSIWDQPRHPSYQPKSGIADFR